MVVKIQRPGLRAHRRRRSGAHAPFRRAHRAGDPRDRGASIRSALLDAFERSITAELDFTREAANAARLAALLEGAPEVRVPRIVTSLVRPTVLVMEEVHGQKLSALAEPEQKAARAALLRAFTRQILDHGVFHADPHPGNVLVEDDGRLVLIDLGAVERVDERLRANLGRLVRALALGRKRALADAVLALSPDGASVSRRSRAPRARARAAGRRRRRAGRRRARPATDDRARAHAPLRLQPSLVALVRALALLDGVLRGLDPARDLVADLRREWVWSFGRRIRRWWRRALGAFVGWRGVAGVGAADGS